MYVHLVHVDEGYEQILGPFDGVQLTYDCLRDVRSGDNIAILDGCWYAVPIDPARPYTDVTFSEERPA